MHACTCTLALSLRALLLAGVGLLIIGVAVMGYLLNKYNFDIRVVAIGVDYFQVLAIFANARVKWPAAIKELFRILSALYVRARLCVCAPVRVQQPAAPPPPAHCARRVVAPRPAAT